MGQKNEGASGKKWSGARKCVRSGPLTLLPWCRLVSSNPKNEGPRTYEFATQSNHQLNSFNSGSGPGVVSNPRRESADVDFSPSEEPGPWQLSMGHGAKPLVAFSSYQG